MQLRQIGDANITYILRLLSLDILKTFYNDLGLQLKNEEEFSIFCKKIVRSLYSPTVFIEKREYGIWNYLKKEFNGQFKEDEIDKVNIWLNSVFYVNHSDAVDVSCWKIIFEQLITRSNYKIIAAAEINNWLQIRKNYLKFQDDKDLAAKYEIERKTMLSDWDLEVFADLNFCYFDEECEPYVAIAEIYSNYMFLCFLDYCCNTYDEKTLEQIHSYGLKILNELKIYHVEPFPDLKTLLTTIEFSALKHADNQ